MAVLKDDKEINENLESQSVALENNVAPIVVVDLGKVSRKQVKNLKKGKGKLIGEVQAAVQLAEENMNIEKGVAPIVFVYERKPKRKKGFRLF